MAQITGSITILLVFSILLNLWGLGALFGAGYLYSVEVTYEIIIQALSGKDQYFFSKEEEREKERKMN